MRYRVAAQHHAGAAIVLGKVVERPHGTDLGLQAGKVQGIDLVVAMEDLMVFARQDLDPRGAADTVGHAVGPEDCVGHRQHPGVADHPDRGRRVAQHAGDAQGAVAVEVVLLKLAVGVELGPHFGSAGAVDTVLIGGEIVLSRGPLTRFDIEEIGREAAAVLSAQVYRAEDVELLERLHTHIEAYYRAWEIPDLVPHTVYNTWG
jgi:hypothetical protein